MAVFMGGRSGEHDVSLSSGRAVLTHLPGGRFAAFPVVLGRDGRWALPTREAVLAREAVDPAVTLPLPAGLSAVLDRRPAVAFIAMHGPEGEDGKLQSLCDLVGLRYTGSDAYASSLAMNKPVAKAVYRAAGIPVAGDLRLRREVFRADRAAAVADVRARFAPPWVLKTPKLGSSVGLTILPAEGDLRAELESLLALDTEVLVEEFVAGRELTCAVLDAAALGGRRALPLIEIRPVHEPFFNYKAKYTPGEAEEVCPAPVPADLAARISALAVQAHAALGCRGFSRTDFIWAPDDRIVTLETNTIPGLTETSLLPQAARAAGLSFADLVSGMTLAALEGQAT